MNLKYAILALSIGAFSASVSGNTLVSTNSLQNGLNNITDGDFYDVNADQYNPDEVWNITATGASISRLIFEFASFENDAQFGIYDIFNKDNKLMIFDGESCGTADNSCTPQSNLATTLKDTGFEFSTAVFGGSIQTATFASENFGYYLTSRQGTFYSQSSLNTDIANDQHNNTTDHMIAFRGDDSTRLDINFDTTDPEYVPDYDTFQSGEYILAWEDLLFPNSDYDYSDFVVMVESVESVPEPGTLALLGLGLAGLGAARRRQKA